MEVKCTILKTLFAEMRSSSARDSLMVMVLLSDMFIETCPGPSIIFRPASPKLEPLAFTQGALGAQNAAVLNHLSTVGSLTELDCPATTLARSDPLTPRPMSSPRPTMRGATTSPGQPVRSPRPGNPRRRWPPPPLVTNPRFPPTPRRG